jgi:hypothetical protein
MEDKKFEREKLRRDLQEALNAVDEAIAAENTEDSDNKDTLMLIRLIPFTFEFGKKVEMFTGKPVK